jgi:hypothetical protein
LSIFTHIHQNITAFLVLTFIKFPTVIFNLSVKHRKSTDLSTNSVNNRYLYDAIQRRLENKTSWGWSQTHNRSNVSLVRGTVVKHSLLILRSRVRNQPPLWTGKTIGLHHPLDGVTNPKYKLLHFIQLTNLFCKEKALAFNWDTCCHLALCLWLILHF